MGQSIEQRAGQPFGPEDLGPFVEGQIRGHERRRLLVALGEDLEEQLGAGLRQRHIAELVDDQQILLGELLLKMQQALVIPRLERPEDLADKAVFTPEEFAARNAQVAERVRLDNRPRNETGAYNEFWMERGSLNLRTSLITDPADGRLPPLTAAETRRRANHAANREAHSTDSYENRSAYDRCISRGLPGAMMPGFYNHNYQIFQTPDHVVVLVEMIHDTRIIPLDRRPHLDSDIEQWLGDSRGWWEGDTLVVETRNLTARAVDRSTTTFGAGRQTTVVERFTRTSADTLDYQLTVADPMEYSTSWTATMPMTALGGQLYEYACHEGNYAIGNILSGARAEEMTTR